ncbi:MAG: RHS repeat-associated core domain-containing protein, partial [Hyphomicrobiales bacterium]|nr:RHS repeat-associated core domain-containing protein [Hyphomicrobiales bacterium]
PGQWFQLESGLAYNWHRHYDATLGRYVQPDPLGLTAMLSDGPSVYGYVDGNPVAYVDRNGQFLWLPFIVAAGTAFLTSEVANAPGDGDEIIQSSPLLPYENGLIAGLSVAGGAFCAAGKEIKGANWRIAPGGNRTDNVFGKWPHYHRRGQGEGQGIGRHRPWETKRKDTSFWDRF